MDQIKVLGRELGLSVFHLEIMRELPDNMVRAWLRREDRVTEKCGDPLTWEILVKSLQKIGQTGIADDILIEKYRENEKSMYMYVHYSNYYMVQGQSTKSPL